MVAAALLGVGVSTAPKAKAANLYWDANGSVAGVGGTGTWDTTSAFWSSSSVGTDAAAVASFTANDIAYFTGTAGTVTLGGATTIGGLVFSAAGAPVLTGSTLTLAGTPSITVNNGSSAVISSNVTTAVATTFDVGNGQLDLRGVLSGAGALTKNGNGLLVLRGTNTNTGTLTINAGQVWAAASAGLGASAAGQGTIVADGATLGLLPITNGSAAGTFADPLSLQGAGYLGNGALRSVAGANGSTYSGAITLLGASRIQSDFGGTLNLTGGAGVTSTLTAGGLGFVQLGGVISGSADIIHVGISGLRFTGATNTYSGTIKSVLGEIRAETQGAYDTTAGFDIANSVLQIVHVNNANVTGTKLPDAAPITLRSGRLYSENSSFGSTGLNPAFTYTETVGAVTLASGHNQIGLRAMGATGANTLTLASLTRNSPGTTLLLQVDSIPTSGQQLGAGTQNRLLNAALESGGADVAFVGGWAYTNAEFVKYVRTTNAGHGYRALEAANYAVDASPGTWTSTSNVKLNSSPTIGSGTFTVQSLNIQSGTGRTLTGNANSVLVIESGGLLTNGATHTISGLQLTAGASSAYELYDIAWASNVINSAIVDNGANPVSLVKVGDGTTSLFGANTYSGTTFLSEGRLRLAIGSTVSALGAGNLNISGYAGNQSVLETDRNFTRALGSGAGQVRLTGGQGAGFGAYGAPIRLDFGGAGGTVTWGSADFNPGIFTLNGGGSTHVVTLVNPLDLGGEQRYFRIDGNNSGGERAAFALVLGDISNGGVVKRGGGQLVFESAKTYTGGTMISEGALTLRGAGRAGANVIGNDIFINQNGNLQVESPDNIGSNQLVVLQNINNDTPATVTLGSGYGTGEGIVFGSLTATGGNLGLGGKYFLIANNQSGQARRLAVGLSGLTNFSANLTAQILAAAPNVEAWFGADAGSAVFTGAALSPTGGATTAYRLGASSQAGATLTIAGTNVLSGAFPLIVGNSDQNDRTYNKGTVYLPQGQSYSGSITSTVSGGLLLGNGGILQIAGVSGLNSSNNAILLRGGELRLNYAAGLYGATDTQYSARTFDLRGGTSTLRTTALSGGGFGKLQVGAFTLGDRDSSNNRVLTVATTGTIFSELEFSGITLSPGSNPTSAVTGYFYLDVGVDNSFQAGAGMVGVAGVISNDGLANLTMGVRKRNGGVLILSGDNAYDGETYLEQGRLVLANLGAAGAAGSTIRMATNGDRRSDLDFRASGAGPFYFNNSLVADGGNDGSIRLITVGPPGADSTNQTVQVASLTLGAANSSGTTAATGQDASAVWFDGSAGYRFTVNGTTTLSRISDFRTRGALVTLQGVVSGAFALGKYEQGTLVLNAANTYSGGTNVYNGYLVAGHDTAFNTQAVTFSGGTFSQVLASGTRTIANAFTNSATGSSQTLGGLDAGAKTFSGALTMTRSLNLTATASGDVIFTGVASGAGGLTKEGNGRIILAPSTGAGNSFTGAVAVTSGVLEGRAQSTSGSPFGANTAITLTDGRLHLQGLAAPTAHSVTTTTGALTVDTGATGILVADVAADTFDTKASFGSLARTANGTLILKGQRTDLGSAGEEKVSFTTAPSLVNGLVGTWAVIQPAADTTAHYATVGSGNVITATYGAVALDGSTTNASVINLTGASALAVNSAAFAVRTDGLLDLAGFTLSLGQATSATVGQAGLILNAGAGVTGITGSRVDIGTNALSVYVDAAASSAWSVPISNRRVNSSNTMVTALTKFGPGTLSVGANLSVRGNIQVNEGTLSLSAANVIPTFGNINALTGSAVTIRPGATILLNSNDQEFGALAGSNIGAAFNYSGGLLSLGSAKLTVGRDGASTTFSGQLTGDAGSKLIKIGGGTLILDNLNGRAANSLSALEVNQGTVATWINDQSWATPLSIAGALPATTSVTLRGGTWSVRAIGDSTANQQRIPIGNNLVVTGGDSILNTIRATGSGSNKLLTFGTLSLGLQRFLTNNDNTFIPRFDGLTTLTTFARIQTDGQLVLAGGITGGYSLEKRGGSDLTISGDNTAWSGGMVLTDGTLLFGTRGADDIRTPGTTFTPSSTANAGTGDIVVNRGTILRLNDPANVLVAQGQRISLVGSQNATLAVVQLGRDAAPSAYGLTATSGAGLVLHLQEGLWTTPLDLAAFPDGRGAISAVSNTYYTAATLGAGLDGNYRFGGNGSGTLALTTSGVLRGVGGVEIGKPHTFAGANPVQTEAFVRVYGNQTYSGATTIYREADAGSIGAGLELTGDSATSAFNVYGRLTLRGDGRLTDDAGALVNPVVLFPGSNLRFDYTMDVNDSFVISRLNESNLGWASDENKYADTQPLVLDGANLTLVSSNGRMNQERVGVISAKGGAEITLERTGTNGQMVLSAAGLTRVGLATLALRENGNELGLLQTQSMKMFVDTAPTLTNGMVDPWMINYTRQQFLGYNTTTGFTNAPYEAATPVAAGGDAYLTSLGGTKIVQIAAGWGDTALAAARSVYALRVNHEASANDMTWTGGQINILSGGLITDNRDNARVVFDTTPVYFGDGTTPVVGTVYVDENITRINSLVTAAGLAVTGPGALQLTRTTNAITGTIQLNGAVLYVDGPGSAGTATIRLHGDYHNNNNAGQMSTLFLRTVLTTSGGTDAFANPIVIAENVPVARIELARYDSTSIAGDVTLSIPSLSVEGGAGPAGTLLHIQSSSPNNDRMYNLTVVGATTIGGTAPLAINTTITAGGVNRTFRLQGAVTASAPIYKSGDGVLRFDAANTALTSPVFLNRGEIRLVGEAATAVVSGSGDYRLNFGQLRLSRNGTTTFLAAANQDITAAGTVTIVTDRNAGSSSAMTYGSATGIFRTVNGAQVRFISDSYGDAHTIASPLLVNDAAAFHVGSASLTVGNALRGSGTLVKSGVWYSYLASTAANTDWTGRIDVQSGVLVVSGANATLGTAGSSAVVRAGTALSINAVSQFGTGAGVSQVFTSNTSLVGLGVRTVGNLDTVLAHYSGKIQGDGVGIVALDNSITLAADPAMAGRFGGNWWLGGIQSGGTITAASIAPWGVSSNEFRFGAGMSGLTLTPTATAAQLAGASNRLLVGAPQDMLGQGSLTINNASNTYGGGTIIHRGRGNDGLLRAAVLSLQGGANGVTTSFYSPLGTGAIDVFGELRIEGASGTLATTGGGNRNAVNTYPGARIRFSNETVFTGSGTTGNLATGTLGGGGRWGDAVGLTLNGATLEFRGDDTDHVANREVMGTVSFSRGSQIEVVRTGTTARWAELQLAGLTRLDDGTLQLRHNGGKLGVAGAADAERLIVAGGVTLTNGMAPAWMTSRSENNFLRYDATLGFQVLTAANTPNLVALASAATTVDSTNLTVNDGTRILDNSATAAGQVLALNPDVHALRLSRDLTVSTDTLFDRITVRSGGIIQVANTPTIFPDLYFGAAGDGAGEAYVWASNNTLQFNGRLFTSKVVKSGTAFLNVRSDQPHLSAPWVINGGGIQFLTPGAQGSGTVTLHGSKQVDGDTNYNITEVRYNFNSGSPDLFTWGGGDITSFDNNRVYVVLAADRLQQLPAVALRTSNAVAGQGMEGYLLVQVDGARSTARFGTVTLHDHYMVHVESGTYGSGSSTGVQFGATAGTGGLNNQGLFNLRKVGDGALILGDNSASFTGSARLEVGEGSVRVTHAGSLGAATVTARIGQGAALELATAGWAPTATLVQMPGSFERWAVDGARSGNITLPAGVGLQVIQNQTSTQTITLNGGSVMGYVPRDWDHVAVIQKLGAGVTLSLAADSSLGQPFVSSSNGVWDYAYFDLGKQNTNGFDININDAYLRGSYLQIDGAITGAFNLTKVGKDVILLAGANTHASTTIEDGTLQIGRTNALAPASSLRLTTTSAYFDLNGFDQQVGSLAGAAGTILNGAFATNTLTVSQSTDSVFGGTINGNIALVKKGAGVLSLAPVNAEGDATAGNSFRGGLVVEAGLVSVVSEAALGALQGARTDAVVLNGGGLRYAASLTTTANRGITVGSGGGTLDVPTGVNVTLATAVAGSTGTLTKAGVGGLTIVATIPFSGDYAISGGTLQIGAGGTTGSIGGGAISNAGTLVINRSDDVTMVNAITGNGAVTKQGSARLTLTGANGITGTLTIAGGTLQVGNAGTAGSIGTGAIVNNGSLVVSRSDALAISGAITGSGTLTKLAAGNLTLSGANSFAGATLVSAGTLTASSGSLAGTSGITVNGAVLSAVNYNAAATLALDAAATATVSGSALTITGAVTNAGTNADALNFSASTGKITLTSLAGAGKTRFGAAADITGGIAEGTVTVVGALGANITGGTVNAGSLAGAISGGTTTVSGVATITTLTTGTLNLNGSTSSIGTLTSGTINLGTSALTVNDGTFAGLLAGANGSLIKATTGILTLSGANTYGAGTTINLGTLIVGNVGSLGSGAVTVASGATLNLNNLGVANAITVATGGTILGGPSAASVTTTGSSTVSTVLTGSDGLSKSDGGELTLTTPNFYTGATAATGATAVIKAAFLSDTSSSLGASDLSVPSNLTLGSGATLEFNGSTNTSTARSFTIGGSAGISATGTGTLEFTSASNLATTGDTPGLTLTASNTGTNRFAPTLSSGNPLATLAIDGTGVWVIGNGMGRFKNDIRVAAGAGSTIGLENNALPSGATLAVANNATVRWEAGNTTAVKLEIVAGTAAKLNLGSNNVVFSTAPVVASGSGTTANFEKQGTGTLTIAASVNAGAFNFSLPANSGMLSVGTGGTVGNVSLAIDSKLGGTGTVGDITAASGSTISPGNSPGTLSTGTIAMPGGSIFEWQVQDATDPVAGYDTLAISGNLDLRGASASNKVIFKVQSLLGTGNGTTLGDPLNFDPPAGASSIRVFNFATVGGDVLTTGGLQISDVFQFDVSQFTYSDGSLSNAGLWSINWDSANHLVTVTAVPEPSTYGFGLGALALAAAAIRRRKRQATKA
jgi:autotransporter-associated beta strand protein